MEKERDLYHSFLQGCGQITNGLTNRTAAGGSAPENSQVVRLPLLNCNLGFSILCLCSQCYLGSYLIIVNVGNLVNK